MNIKYYNVPISEKYQDIKEECLEFLVIELDKIANKEKQFLDDNYILYKIINDKIEIIILGFFNYLVEYNATEMEGIYFKKTKEFEKFLKEADIFFTENEKKELKNLIICQKNLKIEITTIFNKKVLKKDKKMFKNHL